MEKVIPKHILEKVEEFSKRRAEFYDESFGAGTNCGARFMYELLSPEIAEAQKLASQCSYDPESTHKRLEVLEARIKDLRAALKECSRDSYTHRGGKIYKDAIEQDDKARGGNDG